MVLETSSQNLTGPAHGGAGPLPPVSDFRSHGGTPRPACPPPAEHRWRPGAPALDAGDAFRTSELDTDPTSVNCRVYFWFLLNDSGTCVDHKKAF